jgi:Phosphoesterase family
MHRALSQWQGREVTDCGPDVTGLLELTPIGNHQILMRRRFSSTYHVWTVDAGGKIGRSATAVRSVEGGKTAGFAFLAGPQPRVLVYDPRAAAWNLYTSAAQVMGGDASLIAPQIGSWPDGDLFIRMHGQPEGHQFIGLENDHLLDRTIGDGSVRIWRVVPVPGSTGSVQINPVANLVGAPRDAFRRGHRLVHIGPGRLLEWMPRPCAPADTAMHCADFKVWSYDLDTGTGPHDPFAAQPQPSSSGSWNDIGAGDDILADDSNLFVWSRALGRLRSYTLNPTALDPLAAPTDAVNWPLDELIDPALASRDWDPPTQSPAIKHLVVILQNGRSFDSYFGQYCRGEAMPDSRPLLCEEGPDCCDAMPASVPGAPSCAMLDPTATNDYVPEMRPACMRAKIHDGAMDGFAVAPPDGTCGDPRDFACAGDAAEGALADYHRLAGEGALADRFFQTYAYADGSATAMDANPLVTNLIYLTIARFGDPAMLGNTPTLTKELARVDVPWATYSGRSALALQAYYGPPEYYDPDWYPYRSLEGGELEYDLGTGNLPSVAIVIPDASDPARSEAPGHPFAAGIEYVKDLASTIAESPIYRGNTLVLLTYITAGGYYDHVSPPAPPEEGIDSSWNTGEQGGKVFYGPRVPLLAFKPFAWKDHISHVQLEMASITVFIEWNWLRGLTLKGSGQRNDPRSYRDTEANNIGSLIDPSYAVPVGR